MQNVIERAVILSDDDDYDTAHDAGAGNGAPAAGTTMAGASPLEVIFVAKLAHAVEGMSRNDAGPIVAWMVERYKNSQEDALLGKPFQELHDLETLDPLPEWEAMYVEAITELKQEFSLEIDI